MKYSLIIIAYSFLFSCFLACNPKPATGDGAYDSLFLGIYLGMDKDEFYKHCWDMNKKKMLIHGPTNQSVEYRLISELDHPVYMRFYPYFYQNNIYQMPVTFAYEAWAPWNKHYYSNELMDKVVAMLERWYGIKFESTTTPKRGKVYANITGNRRIAVFIQDEQFVQAVITDIPAERLLKENTKANSEQD